MPDRADPTALTEATIDALARGFRLPESSPAARRLLRPLSRRFARRIGRFDDLVAVDGLAAGARTQIPTFVRSLTTVGRDLIPPSGPVLAVANHPGVIDGLALAVALEARADLRVLALDRAFLQVMPGLSSRLLLLRPGDGFDALRRAAEHLRTGGTLLTFPAGTIEPDPVVADGAVAALDDWARSADVLARRVPGVRLVPLAIGGVLSAAALRTGFVRRAPTRADREWRATTLQVLSRHYRDADVRILVGEPFEPGPEPTAELIVRMRTLLGDLAAASGR